MDNTLSLLYNSAISRGLAHKLTRNLPTISHRRNESLRFASEKHSGRWRPSGEPVHTQPQQRQNDYNEAGELAWNLVGEVVRMAEGRDHLILRHGPQRRRKTYRDLE